MRRALLECDPDAPLFAPNNMARKARANWARHIELGSLVRPIPDSAREGAAPELNRSGFQDTAARCSTLLHSKARHLVWKRSDFVNQRP
jgi:hypothetical protein